MFRWATRWLVAASLAAALTPGAAATAAPVPTPSLDSILASPPAADYQPLDPATPGILLGRFDAGGYASIGGPDSAGGTVKTLREDGFVQGFGGAWVQAATHRVLVEIIVAFTGGGGAGRWLGQSRAADLADPTYQHAISVDGIDQYYGARMSDTTSYFADAFVFVKGNDGFLVTTVSDSDNLGDSAAAQARVQYDRAPAYTIPPSGWPGATPRLFTVAGLTALAARATVVLAGLTALFWLGVLAGGGRRRRQRAGLPSGL